MATDGVSLDFSDLLNLAADLRAVTDLVPKKADQAVQQTALKTRDFWRKDAKQVGGPSTKGYPRSITYDKEPSDDGPAYVVGPNIERYGGKTGKGGLQPSLGILEEASGGVRGPGRQSISRAAAFAGPELEKGIDIAVADSMKTVR